MLASQQTDNNCLTFIYTFHIKDQDFWIQFTNTFSIYKITKSDLPCVTGLHLVNRCFLIQTEHPPPPRPTALTILLFFSFSFLNSLLTKLCLIQPNCCCCNPQKLILSMFSFSSKLFSKQHFIVLLSTTRIFSSLFYFPFDQFYPFYSSNYILILSQPRYLWTSLPPPRRLGHQKLKKKYVNFSFQTIQNI